MKFCARIATIALAILLFGRGVYATTPQLDLEFDTSEKYYAGSCAKLYVILNDSNYRSGCNFTVEISGPEGIFNLNSAGEANPLRKIRILKPPTNALSDFTWVGATDKISTSGGRDYCNFAGVVYTLLPGRQLPNGRIATVSIPISMDMTNQPTMTAKLLTGEESTHHIRETAICNSQGVSIVPSIGPEKSLTIEGYGDKVSFCDSQNSYSFEQKFPVAVTPPVIDTSISNGTSIVITPTCPSALGILEQEGILGPTGSTGGRIVLGRFSVVSDISTDKTPYPLRLRAWTDKYSQESTYQRGTGESPIVTAPSDQPKFLDVLSSYAADGSTQHFGLAADFIWNGTSAPCTYKLLNARYTVIDSSSLVRSSLPIIEYDFSKSDCGFTPDLLSGGTIIDQAVCSRDASGLTIDLDRAIAARPEKMEAWDFQFGSFRKEEAFHACRNTIYKLEYHLAKHNSLAVAVCRLRFGTRDFSYVTDVYHDFVAGPPSDSGYVAYIKFPHEVAGESININFDSFKVTLPNRQSITLKDLKIVPFEFPEGPLLGDLCGQ